MTDDPKDSPDTPAQSPKTRDTPDESPKKRPKDAGRFGVDSSLAEAMAAAEASYSKLEDQAREEQGVSEPDIEDEDGDAESEGFELDVGGEDEDEDDDGEEFVLGGDDDDDDDEDGDGDEDGDDDGRGGDEDDDGDDAPPRKKGSPPTSGAPAGGGAGEGIVRALAQLREALEAAEVAETKAEEAEKKAERAESRWVRVSADFDNFKKRNDRERQEERKYQNEKLLKELFPVLDSLDRAIGSAPGSTLEQFNEGVELVRKQFLGMLAKFGVEQFSALGKPFDPEFHEAMQQQETTDVAPGTVMDEYIKGYILNGRLARPAMVIVAKAPPGAEPQVAEDPAPAEEPTPTGEEPVPEPEDPVPAVEEPAAPSDTPSVAERTPPAGESAAPPADSPGSPARESEVGQEGGEGENVAESTSSGDNSSDTERADTLDGDPPDGA